MTKDDIAVGNTYVATVGGRGVEVRINRVNPCGGWDATALGTNKRVRLKTARHVRRPVSTGAAADDGAEPTAEAAATTTDAAARPAGPDPDLVPLTKATAKARGGRRATAPPKPKAKAPAAGVPAATAPKGMTCLDAAAAVLAAKGGPMRCGELVAAMAERGLWTTTAPTPAATLSSAILREVGRRVAAARFRKAGRGLFALNPAAATITGD